MKLIGITGNYGKTTTCEMLYKYLIDKGFSVGLICSNGVFQNNETVIKEKCFTRLANSYYTQINNNDYVIIELNEESIYAKKLYSIFDYTFDILCNVSYSKRLCDKHSDLDNFLFKLIDETKAVKKLCNKVDEEILSANTSSELITYNNITIKGRNEDNNIIINYNNDYNTKFKTSLEINDLSAVLAIINELEIFDEETFTNLISNVLIRGRFEIYNYNNKTIILDTGWYGVDYTLNLLVDEGIIDLNDTCLILVPFLDDYKLILREAFQSNDNLTRIKWRKAIGKYIKDNNIETIVYGNARQNTIFHKLYSSVNNTINYEYTDDVNEAINKAIESDKEYIYIASNHSFRQFREILKEK